MCCIRLGPTYCQYCMQCMLHHPTCITVQPSCAHLELSNAHAVKPKCADGPHNCIEVAAAIMRKNS